MKASRIGVVVIALLAAGAGVAGAAADSPDQLIDRALELGRNGDHASALELLGRAYTLRPADARTVVQMGFAEYALGRWADAEAHLVEGLRQSEDPWIVFGILCNALGGVIVTYDGGLAKMAF
jgi:hypothetical protein